MKRILIIATHGVGDLVMFFPTLEKIFQSEGKFYILLNSRMEEELFSVYFDTERISVVLINQSGFFRRITALTKLCTFSFKTIYYQSGLSSAKSLSLTILASSPFALAKNLNRWRLITSTVAIHKIRKNLSNINCQKSILELSIPGVRPSYNFKKEILNISKYFRDNDITSGKYIIFAFGSSQLEKHKRLAHEIMQELIAFILRDFAGYKVLFVGDHNDRTWLTAHEIPWFDDPRTLDATGQFSLSEVILLIRDAALVISSDNGLSHISAMSGVKTLTMYGPTNPRLTGITYSETTSIEVTRSACAPCYSPKFRTGCGDPKCMLNFDALKLKKNILNMLSSP